MRKVLSSLIVLAILVGMFVCLGTQAFAEGEAAVFAVSEEQLSPDSIAVMQQQAPDCLIVDVNGLAEGQAGIGYSVVWRESDPLMMNEVAYIWPGLVQMFYVGTDAKLVALVGVGVDSTAEQLEEALAPYLGDDPYVIAIGPKEAAAVIGGCTNVDMFMTSGLEGDEASAAASAVGTAKLENVGSDEYAPVCHVTLAADNTVTTEAIPVPAAVSDPTGGPEAQPEDQGQPAEDPQPTEEPVTYCRITYDGNGNTAGMVPDVTDFIAGQVHFLSTNGYARDGYNFIGWTIDDGTDIYSEGAEVVIDHDTTVHAQWEQAAPAEPEGQGDGVGDMVNGLGGVVVAYPINFNAGAEDAQGTMAPAAVPPGASYTVPACEFTREGYTFVNWKIEETDLTVGPGETINEVPFTLNLTAQWEQNASETPASFTVTYKAEGQTDVVDTVDEANAAGYILKGADAFQAPAKKALAGWDSSDETDPAVLGLDSPYALTKDVTFTALWSDVYTVSFDANGGSGEMAAQTVQSQIGDSGADYGLPMCEFTAPSGKVFAGWRADDGADTLYVPAPGQVATYHLSGDMTFTAIWNDATGQDPGPEIPVVTLYNVTYDANIVGAEGEMVGETVNENCAYKLPDCGFTAAHKHFVNWTVEMGGTSETKAAGDTITVTADTVIKANWEDAFTVTYKPGDEAAAGNDDLVVSNAPAAYKLVECPFTAPSGKTFSNWTIGGSPYDAGATVTLTDDIEVTAVWKDAPVENQTATTQNGNTITWTRGGTDVPSVTFDNAEISTVSVAGIQLTEEKAEVAGKTVTLDPDYLNTLNEGNYNMTVSFQKDANGGTFNPYIMTISVTVPPVVTPEPSPASRTIQMDWARTGNWTYTFDKVPTKVQIYYGTSNGQAVYQDAKSGTDYTVSGNTLTLLPAMVNGNWGGKWPNATYNFRVTLNNDNNDVYTLQLKLTGDAPEITAAPTQTPANNANVPVTGDETPLVLYIVILVVLIAALATVLIVVMKRRNSGSRGRH